MKGKIFLPMFAAVALGLASCSGSGAAAEAFAVDTVGWDDSFEVGACSAKVEISGEYPAGNSALADSVRAWIGSNLGSGVSGNGSAGFTPEASELADGEKLVADCGRALLDMAHADFQGFNADGIGVQYEFNFRFKPEYSTGKVLTYSFVSYVYLGGAHGGSLANDQTFINETGERLTADNMFDPAKLPALVELIKAGLWEQFFSVEAEPGSSLSDVLLIKPDDLGLPAFPPVFTDKGIRFTYQQYEIASYANGMPSCILPYAELKPLMLPAAARLVP